MKNKQSVVIGIVVFILIAIGVGSFFYSGNKEEFSEAALKNNVEKLWNARINRDKKIIYTLLDDAYKKGVTEEQFLKKGDYQITGTYEIKEIKMDSDKKVATVTVKFKSMQMGYQIEPTILEHWLFENNEWHVGYSMRKNPFMNTPKP